MLNMYKILVTLAIVSMSCIPGGVVAAERPVYLMKDQAQLLPGRAPAALNTAGKLLGPEWRPRSGSWSVMDHSRKSNLQPAWDLGITRIQGFYDLKTQGTPWR